MRKIITIILGLGVIAVGIFVARTLAGSKQEQRPQQEIVLQTVFTEEVKNGSIPITVIESGRLVAKNRISSLPRWNRCT